MSVIWLLSLIVIDTCYLLPIDQQIAKEGWFCCQIWLLLSCIFQYWRRLKFENELLIILWLPQKLWEKWREITDSKIVGKWWKWHIRHTNIKHKAIIIVQYTISEDVAFVVKSHENNNKKIDYSPYWFSL